mmetsp:Transcript_18939/g.41008  ORF Transcript_18939/g.41008 Transcript_18939/m.41008 type:complete len:639 (+) Transcript_18939:377-2293(+)
MSSDCYFSTITNKVFHDLTDGTSLPAAAREVLGLGLNFIPIPKHIASPFDIEKSQDRFDRGVGLKVYFAGEEDSEPSNSKLRVASDFQPPLPPLDIDCRLQAFNKSVRLLYDRSKVKPNLNPFQRKLFAVISALDNVIIASADKGLGPTAVDLPWYIKKGLEFLTNPESYLLLSEEQAQEEAQALKKEISDWTFEHRPALTDSETKFLRQKLKETIDDPFGYFYLLIKLHKSPVSTRPVCSDVASLPHALGQWVDEKLQPIVKSQHTYFKNSIALKIILDSLTLKPNQSLFTMDAVSMYDNIPLEMCIRRLEEYLCRPSTQRAFPHYSPRALMDAIKIVMKNNRMRFGDIIAKQIKGIAMGMSPAPTIANLFVALHEITALLQFLKKFLRFLWRFIDDGLGIWIHDPDPAVDAANWLEFKTAVNAGGLSWTFSKRCKKVIFMDMTLEIILGNIDTSLYEKPNALHLFIPPNSCHAPGVITSHIFGNVLRIFQLCSRETVQLKELRKFFERWLDRGFDAEFITTTFTKAITNATSYLSKSEAYRRRQKQKEQEASRHRVFYHQLFHPHHPSSSQIQQLWREKVFCPPGKPQLNYMLNSTGHRIQINRLTVAHHRAPNIGNLLSYRKISNRQGPKVSSYL